MLSKENEHRNDLRKGIHNNKHLQRSFNKGNNFECRIIEEATVDNLIARETAYCVIYEAYDKNKGYNQLKPNEPPVCHITPELRIRMIEGMRAKGFKGEHLRKPEIVRLAAEGKHKKVIIFKDNVFYKEAKSLIEAEELSGVKRQNISAICRGVRISVRGFTFQIDKNPTRKN